MKKWLMLIVLLLIMSSLSGCWDRRYLKDHSLILAIGYDLNEDGTIRKTVSFPLETAANMPQLGGSSGGEYDTITVEGNTIGETDIDFDRHLSQKFDRSKARVLLLGKKLAENGIFSTLDAIYRDPKGALGASVVIVEETAEEGLYTQNNQKVLPSEFYYDILKTGEESGIIIRENIQSISPKMLSGRKDMVLPLIKIQEGKNNINLDGLALFSGEKMTGELKGEHSIMLLILAKKIVKRIQFNLQVTEDEEEFNKNFVTFKIRKEKRKLKVDVNGDDVKADIHVDLRLEVIEYPHNKLYKEENIKKLEKQIEKQMIVIAEETIEKIQEANNDYLGIAERVKAFHYDTWKKIDWREVYPNIPIDVTFNIEISQHGIIY
jgi:spore germination protein KC